MANKTKLNQIGQIAMNVRDLEVAVAARRDVWDMDILFMMPNLAIFGDQVGELRHTAETKA